MSAWRTALRIAGREARRAKGRSALVVAMIMLPILALSFAVAMYDMFRLHPDEELERRLGSADAEIRWHYNGPVRQDATGDWGEQETSSGEPVARTAADLLALLPPGTRATYVGRGIVEVRTVTGIGRIGYQAMDLNEPMHTGSVKILRGTAPTRDDEVALTEQSVSRLGADVGDTVETSDGKERYTVRAIVEFPGNLVDRVVFRPNVGPKDESSPWNAEWLVDTPAPVTWDQVRQLNTHGIVVYSRHVVLNPPPDDQIPVQQPGSDVQVLAITVIVIGLGVLEVVLLAGPAFAVGARRRQRELALVAANGATPAHLRRIVLADGVVAGVIAAAAGIVIGVAGAFLFRGWFETHVTNSRAGGYRAYPLAQLALVGLAICTGLLAAAVPAFTVARQNVVAALAGRRGITRSRRRWLALGIGLVATGTAIAAFGAWRVSANVVLAGLVVGELGLVVCTPALVGLVARFGRVLPLAPRIALRDTARNRAAAAPAIAAVMAAVAGTLALGVSLNGMEGRREATYQPALPIGHAAAVLPHEATTPLTEARASQLTAAARATLPVREVVHVFDGACGENQRCSVWATLPPERRCPYWGLGREPTKQEQKAAARDDRCTGQSSVWSYGSVLPTMFDDGNAVAAVTGATGEDLARARATLRAGGVVINDPQYVVDGHVLVDVSDPAASEKTGQPEFRQVRLPGYAVESRVGFSSIVGSAANLATPRLGGIAVATTRTPTQAEQDAFAAAVRAIDTELRVVVERGPGQADEPILLILAIAAGVITLGASGIATGLATADRRADLATLAAVGASPGVRRVLSLSQSGMIAGLGSILGTVAGTGVAVAVLFALNRRYADMWPAPAPFPIEVPWLNVAIALVAVPAVAMLLAGLLTRARLQIERRL